MPGFLWPWDGALGIHVYMRALHQLICGLSFSLLVHPRFSRLHGPDGVESRGPVAHRLSSLAFSVLVLVPPFLRHPSELGPRSPPASPPSPAHWSQMDIQGFRFDFCRARHWALPSLSASACCTCYSQPHLALRIIVHKTLSGLPARPYLHRAVRLGLAQVPRGWRPKRNRWDCF